MPIPSWVPRNFLCVCMCVFVCVYVCLCVLCVRAVNDHSEGHDRVDQIKVDGEMERL